MLLHPVSLILFLLPTLCATDPLAKCPSLPPVPTSGPPSPSLSFVSLLGSADTVESFFDSHFEKKHLLISHSTRADRRKWLELHRRFLHYNDIGALIAHNASAFTNGSLALHSDLDLVRRRKGEEDIVDVLMKDATEKYAVDLRRVQQAFKDGFGVRFYDMHMRSAVVAELVEGLRSFWMVGTSAHLEFMPGSKGKGEKGEVKLHADDTFMVQMEGDQNVELYEALFPFPSRRHLQDAGVIETVKETVKESQGEVVELKEGDVLYVPRGSGTKISAGNIVSMHLEVNVATGDSVLADGIVAAMHAVKEPVVDNPLDKRLETRGGVEYRANWGDVFESAVRIAAEFLPQLRRFMPLGGEVAEAIEDAGGDAVSEMVAGEVRRFADAAGQALLAPVLDVLVAEDAEKVENIAEKDLVGWAKRTVEEEDVSKMEEWFRFCVGVVAGTEENAHNGVTELQLKLFEREYVERAGRIEWRDHVLERHGVKKKREGGGKEECGHEKQERQECQS